MSAAGSAPFNPKVVLGMLLFGAIAFLATLYFVAAGFTGDPSGNAGSHASANGLNGYSALADLLKRRGYDVSVSRSAAHFDDESLLIMTPPFGIEADELNTIIEQRRSAGPTIVILPKWLARAAHEEEGVDVPDGWVELVFATTPDWAKDLGHKGMIKFDDEDEALPASQLGWAGLGLTGKLPDPEHVQAMRSDEIVGLVYGTDGRLLAGYEPAGGYFPVLADAAGKSAADPRDDEDDDATDYDSWPVVIVAEPDLMNNFGLADRDRAMVALAIVEATLEDYELPITFDVTLNGLGRSQNLLTLAFTPPFLAATLCLVIAALVIGWRAWRRFGPPLAESPVFAFGKRQLATNGAALIQRSKRLHLLGEPYAALVRNRVARMLGLKPGGNPASLEAEIDRLLKSRGLGDDIMTDRAAEMRSALKPHELLRTAHALKLIERELAK